MILVVGVEKEEEYRGSDAFALRGDEPSIGWEHWV